MPSISIPPLQPSLAPSRPPPSAAQQVSINILLPAALIHRQSRMNWLLFIVVFENRLPEVHRQSRIIQYLTECSLDLIRSPCRVFCARRPFPGMWNSVNLPCTRILHQCTEYLQPPLLLHRPRHLRHFDRSPSATLATWVSSPPVLSP